MSGDKAADIKGYHSLCLALLRIILSKDRYTVVYLDPAQFEDGVFGVQLRESDRARQADLPGGAAFVARSDHKKIVFCFDDQRAGLLREIAAEIKDRDRGGFDTICVMIVRDMKVMQDRRRAVRAEQWPRGFFLCFEEIRRKAEQVDVRRYQQLCSPAPVLRQPERAPIMSVTAEVKENIPVGEDKTHYKLRFETKQGFHIVPGQFIMIDAAPRERMTAKGPALRAGIGPAFLEPKSYLKRPFGIHRAFYKFFSDRDYLREVSLPPELAAVLHTVFPDRLEVFYKVLTNGIGTRELSRLRGGDKVRVLGPLGKGLAIGDLRDRGFDEIHVIGGGVGMAPLIFIVQALRYYAYRVKAFIGVERMGMLRYRSDADGLDRSFNEEDPTLYMDDLIETGLDSPDIYVSSNEAEDVCGKIPSDNFRRGLVSDHYNDYLVRTKPAGNVLAFACGPSGMMKSLVPIARKYGIPLKVLMEKRMACGIGVCLSCVCKTRKPGEAAVAYSRVCTDGPIFDAGEIVWD